MFHHLQEQGLKPPYFPKDTAVWLRLKFYFTTQKKKEGWKVSRPDVDNLDKSIMDGGNGILWHDDSQVVDSRTTKEYHDWPHIVLEARKI